MQSISREAFAVALQKARISRRLQKELRFVPEKITDWEDRDFVAVTNKSATEGVLVIPFVEALVPIRLQKRMPNHKGRVEAIICDICATWQRGTASQTITFDKDRRSISFLVCGDLQCSLHVRDKTAEAVLSRTQLRENNSVEERVARLRKRLGAIVQDVEEA